MGVGEELGSSRVQGVRGEAGRGELAAVLHQVAAELRALRGELAAERARREAGGG